MARFVILLFIVICGMSSYAFAHKGRPMFVQLDFLGDSNYRLSWRFPPSLESKDLPNVALAPNCRNVSGSVGMQVTAQQNVGSSLFHCEGHINELNLSVKYPKFNPGIPTLLRVTDLDGNVSSRFASPDQTSLLIVDKSEKDGTIASGVSSYFTQGIIHIAEGIDHLLFVACLIFIAGDLKRILVTITGFTVSHSITLGMSALGIISVPVPPVEAAIALSIVFLAYEMAGKRRDTLTWRYPVLVASTFGLLHGFGFASALGEIGLPHVEKLWALFLFNVGVEVGQILFVFCLVPLIVFLGRLKVASATRIEAGAAFVIGSIATFWTIERIFL